MKVLVDTCGWIEWLTDGNKAKFLDEGLARRWDNPDILIKLLPIRSLTLTY